MWDRGSLEAEAGEEEETEAGSVAEAEEVAGAGAEQDRKDWALGRTVQCRNGQDRAEPGALGSGRAQGRIRAGTGQGQSGTSEQRTNKTRQAGGGGGAGWVIHSARADVTAQCWL